MKTLLPHELSSTPPEDLPRKLVLTPDGPILAIDWSVISYKCWHTMGTANYVKTTKTEKAEFSKNIYKYVTYLIERLHPCEIIFAVDAKPNWRAEYYKDYYRKTANIFYNEALNEYVTEWDFKLNHFRYNEEQDLWLKKAITKVNKKEFIIENEEEELKSLKNAKERTEYVDNKFSTQGPLGYIRIESTEDKNEILYEKLYRHAPRYKKRDPERNWNYETPFNKFKDYAFNMAFTTANTFNAKAIHAEGAEADDVIAAYAKGRAKTGRDFICVSVDQDLHQLLTRNMFFKYYNPNCLEGDHKQPSRYGGFVDLVSPEKQKTNLYIKIIGGDSSDTIFATFKTGYRKLMGPQDVEELMLQTEDPLKAAQEILDRDSLIKNLNLIHLDMRPPYIYDRIVESIVNYKQPEKVYEPSDFHITEVEDATNRAMAREHRKQDMEDSKG